MFPEQSPALEGFEILESLGKGGAGQVFLAKSPAGRFVAIKVLSDDAKRDDSQTDAFAREASLCSRLNHPAIVQLKSFLEKDGFSALVFEYVKGVALGRFLRFLSAQSVRLPDAAAWHVVERVLEALACAHAQTDEVKNPAPIVHRDVSPSNVLIDWSGDVKLTDFGIAKMLGHTTATKEGQVNGTLGCMSPEQARGDEVTERADVYAAALLAWRLATGRAPFSRFKDDERELIRAMRNPRIKPLDLLRPDLPGALLEGIEQALEPEAHRRTITAATLAQIIRDKVDVRVGRAELADILIRWRSALERSVARAESGHVSTAEHSHSQTSRYEEVALAFDEPGAYWHEEALPSDNRILAAVPVDLGDLPPLAETVPPMSSPKVDRTARTVPPVSRPTRPRPALAWWQTPWASLLFFYLAVAACGLGLARAYGQIPADFGPVQAPPEE